MKDHHFSEEQESRLVWVANSWPWPIKTRIAPRGLVPYRAFQFDLEKLDRGLVHPSNFGIEEIILGPALETHQAVAVEALLASQKMRLPINRSAIPYVAD